MSHRVYLYNITAPLEVSKANIMIMEWGYEVPLLLLPLLIDGGFISENIYNTHTDPENFGLYFNAVPGIENIKRFYNFIENHHSELIENLDDFLVAKNKLFDCLDTFKRPYFHVDAWDVFNMNDESHKSQAEHLLMEIERNNSIITKAIEADDVSLMDFSLFGIDVTLGFKDFKTLLNFANYNYGLAHIYKNEQNNDDEIYEENGLWGLKSPEGKVLIEPYFDEYYGYSDSNLAVVVKDGKFGYVDRSGNTVIPLIYEDAYDFEGKYAVIKQDGKFGLIGLNGQIKLPLIYEDVYSLLPYNKYYTAQLNGKYGVISAGGKIILPFNFDYRFEEQDGGDIYFVRENDPDIKSVYSSQFYFLGSFNLAFLEIIRNYHSKIDNYFIQQHQYYPKNTIIAADGKILIDGFDKFEKSFDYVVILQKDKKYALLKHNIGLILGFEFDLITEFAVPDEQISTHFNESHQAHLKYPYNYLKVIKDNLCGVYLITSSFEKWIIPVSYQDIKIFKDGYIGVKKENLWAILDKDMNAITAFEFEELVSLISYAGIAYGLKDENIYAITDEEITFAEKYRLQDYVDANEEYNYCYFNDAVQQKIQAYIDAN